MVQLSISEIRREILRAGGDYDASRAQSNALTGMLFHELVAALMGPDGWRAALEPGELTDSRRLLRHAYDRLLGPRLTEMQASLRESGAEAMTLWQAVAATCDWICRLLGKAEQRGIIRYNREEQAWQGAEKLCQPELELRWEVKDAHWTAAVVVAGVADALWKDVETGRWSVVEYKLGKARPEADLAQACLYHSALSASGLARAGGSLAVIGFGPELTERFYQSAELSEAQAGLRALIGRMANVLPGAFEDLARTTDSRPAPKSAEVPLSFGGAGTRPVLASPIEPVNESHLALGKQIVRKLQDYGVAVEWKGQVKAGPSFLRYFLVPGRQARVKHIRDKAEDLRMQLSLKSEPMIHNSGGRLVVDIERPDPQTVTFSSIVDQLPGRGEGRGSSQVPLGVDLNGKLQLIDLASPNTPHLLVAGTSGSGKSEWLRSAIAGLAYCNTPETLRLVLIDPKRTAFSDLKGSRYLYGPKGLVHPPDDSAIDVLDMLIEEMQQRYELFEQESVGDLPEYQARSGQVKPRIVCICDEYADLLVDRAASKSVSHAIARLGAKARAAGIHLIIATQYPDRKTVEGALKTNLSGRVCLRVSNHHQSSMIINCAGAERLLGKGDLFFLSVGDPVRLQAPYLTAEERTRFLG